MAHLPFFPFEHATETEWFCSYPPNCFQSVIFFMLHLSIYPHFSFPQKLNILHSIFCITANRCLLCRNQIYTILFRQINLFRITLSTDVGEYLRIKEITSNRLNEPANKRTKSHYLENWQKMADLHAFNWKVINKYLNLIKMHDKTKRSNVMPYLKYC